MSDKVSKLHEEAEELSYKILEAILFLHPYQNKDEVMNMSYLMKEVAKDNEKYPDVLKLAYSFAHNKLDALDFSDMQEVMKSVLED